MDSLFSIILWGPPVLVALAGFWLAIDRRRSRAVRLSGGGLSLLGLAELGLLMEWMNNLCWDEGSSCGQPLSTLFYVMSIAWLVMAAGLLAFIAAGTARAIRDAGRQARYRN